MERTLIADTVKKVGEKVKIAGSVHVVRAHGKIAFADITDRSGVLQVVGGDDLVELKPQYFVEIEGTVNARPPQMANDKIKTGSVELSAEKVTILSKSDEMPFDMGAEVLNLELPTLLDYRTLTLRHPKIKGIFEVQSAIVEGFRKFAGELGCTEIFIPTISASATEGGAEVFEVDYYGHKAFMTQSPQLYKQMLVPVFERVFTIAKAYRAEPSVTTRHLSEVTQMDCELGFVDFDGLMDALEFVATGILSHVEEKQGNVLEDYDIPKLKLPAKIPRLTMREAQKIILKRTGVDHTKEKDLDPEDEKEISKWALEEKESDLVTITHFPTKKRSFYTMPDPDDPEFSLSYDLLFRGLEILSGSQRVNDYGKLVDAIKERGMDPKNFEMYLQSFKYGMPQEGGFSFGLERITMKLLNLSNVREASLFPRDMERVDFRFSR
ncbi:MAG: aspartyl-tRNA synthetase, nondiscriminating aspartyl-tRNA synthetase [Microgenomates group bacterium GW2011_GWC1_43_13]|uniref:Aspartyl-tRNA synthetase n=3 Tax=Candidatus Woeseibacteriota TaxID=1752722 RepID=A0A837IAE7_9BACT|nr:MAG: aspartyl-tRNA synthetase, nondiscriminating aspartyl-tRNA synthetase [Microgenomates group bacterium GW2011_GWC1_43_13]KKT33587.1 MAG: Aspartyl-tRNA synthetase [Candidatus Woesebacteria bacterium GW2011_GWB1_44_11]KKT55076.1 MAG: Aspartyl-tRNA synthetase [Candidatus Woesebacteria bacterium GW2011_GWA1_44_23]OGM76815.1 MAG: aspartate--tRNA(Asn) ligase [Candidatus Woesebacteria bacterium RIFOXYA1_FULL_43_16]OGM83210.1 MAG: aspartate--tRNA(Asn) ligase [Candidatus Woesebacteria bacterium RI